MGTSTSGESLKSNTWTQIWAQISGLGSGDATRSAIFLSDSVFFFFSYILLDDYQRRDSISLYFFSHIKYRRLSGDQALQAMIIFPKFYFIGLHGNVFWGYPKINV